ncbi:MAG: hypothetical protein ACP5R5_11395 [Armatimonadota bacterium]
MMKGNLILIGLCIAVLATGQAGQCKLLEVTGASYFADKPFPEYMPMWGEGWSLKDPEGNPLLYAKPGMPLGGYAFVYFRNDSSEAVQITDLVVEGIKLSEGLGVTHVPKSADERYQSSIYLSKLPKEQIEKLKSVGEPVWWKAEPMTIDGGHYGEIVLRLRRDPPSGNLKFGIVTDRGETVDVAVPVGPARPRFETIAFSPDLGRVYAYVRHPKPGMRPQRIYIDGADVTPGCKIGSDSSLELVPVVIDPVKPFAWMSYHNFRAVYPDGSTAQAGIRAWGRDIVYGMWGSPFDVGRDEDSVRALMIDWAKHNINCAMGIYGGDTEKFYWSDKGWEFTESLGIGRMTHWIVPGQKPTFLFAMDEPDACDANTEQVEPLKRLGTSGQWLAKWIDVLHRKGPESPILLNVDGTYKPENYYTYHQLPDIPCIDPYYQGELDLAYTTHPWLFATRTKPTYVYATSTISQSAGAPKPLHVILCSTKYPNPKHGYPGRWPTPEEKRIEVYYAIAAGAKGLSYWWYTPDSACIGCGKDDPDARKLYDAIGLLGAEVRTAGPVITTSCPIDLPLTGSRFLWLRALASGLDTIAVIAVNDNVLCDRLGTIYRPLERAKAAVTVPAWLTPKDVFEITYQGIKDVAWKLDGTQLALELGTVDLSRFVIVTADPGLRERLKSLYETKFAENAKALQQ